jgi:hypothetical protein
MPDVRDPVSLRAQIEAAKHADWQQVVLNGGPPCFCLLDGRFCLRAERWDGHRDGDWPYHKFVSLADVLSLLEAYPGGAETWQPIETAPKDEEVFFWIVPKTADEMYMNTSGEPMAVSFKPYRKLCKRGGWAANAKAVLWHQAPSPPAQTTPERHDKEQ